MTLKRDDEMPFGQYRGQTMDWILQFDPTYILWLEGKVDMEVEFLDCAYDIVHRTEDSESFPWEDE